MNIINKKYLDKLFSVAKKANRYSIAFYAILILAFVIRAINLNYNSAFNDEAIYIVIGRMGLFANDWWSYGAKLWMAGLPYIYPTFAALAYEVGGLAGSRLLNVLFGIILIEEVYRFVRLLNFFDRKTNTIAALIAAFLVAFSGIGMHVSKLATYDMPSFMFFMLGINSFLKAKQFSNGKYYFLTFLFLFLAFLTKIIIAIFFPILFIISIWMLKDKSREEKQKAAAYLYGPFVLATIVYVLSYRDNLMTYVNTHKELGKSEGGYKDILDLIWFETHQTLMLSIPTALLLINYIKARKALLSLVALIVAVPLFHLALSRYATLDKHLYLTVIFLSVIVGYGVSIILANKNKIIRLVALGILPVIAGVYMLTGYRDLAAHEHEWKNSTPTQEYLRARVKPGDKILTEEGSAIALGLYDIIFPPKSIVTFDWIDYSGMSGDKAYYKAVDEGYFDYIELDGEFLGEDERRKGIEKRLGDNYHLVYTNGAFKIYEKN